MRILASIAAATLMIAAPAAAQTQAATPPALSDTARQAFQAMMEKRKADLAPLVKRKVDLEAQFDGLLTPATYDGAKLAAIMGEMKTVEGQIFETMGMSLLAFLAELPEADRAQFMKTITKTPPGRAAASR